MEKKCQVEFLDELTDWIARLSRRSSTLLIGIDGCGGSGKSTLAKVIASNCTQCVIVHMDDFYLPSQQIIKEKPQNKPIGADYDWERMRDQVLVPLHNDREGLYQRYDWDNDQLEEWHTVPVGGVVIVEGVYSTRNELKNDYDLKIWVDCPRKTRLARGLERDGEAARERWENDWMISEDVYVKEQQPEKRADILIDGTKLLK